jgi:hypothetical protein
MLLRNCEVLASEIVLSCILKRAESVPPILPNDLVENSHTVAPCLVTQRTKHVECTVETCHIVRKYNLSSLLEFEGF